MHKRTIQIEAKTLENIIEKYSQELSKKLSWTVPFGIFITCVIALLTSEFNDFGPFNKPFIEALFFLVAFVSFVYTVCLVFSHFRKKNRNMLQITMDMIYERADNPVEMSILFIISTTKFDPSGKPKLLVYKDLLWNCWFLPNMDVGDFDLDVYKEYVAGELGFNKASIVIEMYPPTLMLHSEKKSAFFDIHTYYQSRFCFVKINNIDNKDIENRDFTVSGREFHWMSVTEMMEDPSIRECNYDVLQHLHDKNGSFFYKKISL